MLALKHLEERANVNNNNNNNNNNNVNNDNTTDVMNLRNAANMEDVGEDIADDSVSSTRSIHPFYPSMHVHTSAPQARGAPRNCGPPDSH